ncbi:MAG: hypothetical protein V4459_01555 [Pseudomonadota bacterium]
MIFRVAITAVTLVALTGCGGSGPSTSGSSGSSVSTTPSGASIPDQFVGTWAADCTSPYVRFNADGTMHVYPDNADYTIKSAALDGSDLKVGYVSASGETTDVYASEGSTLRLTRTIAGGQEAAWTKAPMSKCS